MIPITNFPVPLDYSESSLREAVLKKLALSPDQLLSVSLYRRSVDARDRSDVHFVLSLDLTVKNESALLRRRRDLVPVSPSPVPSLPASRFSHPPLVVGAGPAGLFCALTLARAGAAPILIERGKPVEDRAKDVSRMTEEGILSEESNVQFGEGGAGAFSDGRFCRHLSITAPRRIFCPTQSRTSARTVFVPSLLPSVRKFFPWVEPSCLKPVLSI